MSTQNTPWRLRRRVSIGIALLLILLQPAYANGGHTHLLGSVFFLLLAGVVFIGGLILVIYFLLRTDDNAAAEEEDAE